MKKLSPKLKRHQVATSRKVTNFREHTPHHLIQIKETPDVWKAFVQELNSGRHQDIVDACKPLATFEDCLAEIAATLSIALDGLYDPGDLAGVLLGALQRRTPGNVQPHNLDPKLVAAEIIEKVDGSTSLELAAESMHLKLQKVDSGEGPYTICDACLTSLECITARSCGLGKPAMQLGNTVKTLETLRRSLH